jgi:integrase
MAKTFEKLSPLAVARLKKPGRYGDGGNLWLQVSPYGTKSWFLRYTIAGVQREMGLGPLHTVSLSEARERAKKWRLVLLDGKDPMEVRDADRLTGAIEKAKAMSFDQCAEAYIAAHRSGWKNAKHADQWKNTLATYASPIIGNLPVALIDTGLVVKVLSQPSTEGKTLWEAKTETATRLRGRMESILDWATVSKYRMGENPARWKGHLDHLLADPSKTKKTVHHPALPWQEIGAFMSKLRKQEGVAAKALEFGILTACRSGEVRLAEWSEIDFEAALWTIPADRMKAGREHRVPLSKPALSLLRARLEQRDGDLIFQGAKRGAPLSNMTLTACLRRMKRGDITVHGFRSTFRDWCSESVANSFPREVCEHALAHSLPDKTEAAYRRGDLIEKRTLLMKAWAEYCSE